MSDLYMQKMEARLLELQERIAMSKRDIEERTKGHNTVLLAYKDYINAKQVDIEIMEGIVKYLDTRIQKK